METIIPSERQRVQDLAKEYRSKGYEVIEQPLLEQLPDFLSDYRPDLLIRRGTEAIVVEVKSRSSLTKSPQIRDLARVLQTKPGWKFELVMVGEEEDLNTPEGSHPFAREDAHHRLEAVEKLLEAGSSEAALLLGWGAVEATVRLLAVDEGVELDRLAPSYLLKQAATNGVISREDYNFLMRVMKYRNALAHGFKTVDFDSTIVRDLIKMTKNLLEEKTGAPPKGAESSSP